MVDKFFKNFLKLFFEFFPTKKQKTDQLTGKPNSHHDTAEGEEDKDFLNIIHKIHVDPRRKYSEPITESQGQFFQNYAEIQNLYFRVRVVFGAPVER